MMNDTVREELETKITSNSGGLSAKRLPSEPPRPNFLIAKETAPAVSEPVAKIQEEKPAPAPKVMTTELPRKHTSKTLVDFQAKNPTLPDWRLQLQNAVRQRSGTAVAERPASQPTMAVSVQQPATNGANALKMEIESVPQPRENANPRLESVIDRIERSRRQFLVTENAPVEAKADDSTVRKFPFEVVTPNGTPRQSPAPEPIAAPKPKLVTTLRIEKKDYDTNKLPPIPTPEDSPLPQKEPKKLGMIVDGIEPDEKLFVEPAKAEESIAAKTVEVPQAEIEYIDETEDSVQEIDDLAPLSMRFGAGLFDFIIAGFGTLIILSPLMLSGGTWASIAGVLTITASLCILLFLYMTASLAVWGKTFGMRIFSLELIDADANVYPTVHQAAVNSAVYLLSLAFGGAGFLTMLFTEEKRAVHDIVSGTLLIREI
jgi:uncharacterized RDD family membrane protein YckC